MRRYLLILIFTVFGLNNFVSSLKCKCTARIQGPTCSSDGVCTIDKGVCGIGMIAGQTLQSCQDIETPFTGCVKAASSLSNDSSQCTCTDKDFCNEKMGQTDFGKRPSPTIKCKCSPGTDGCDPSGTCTTPGICVSISAGVGGHTQVQNSCFKQGQGQVGCLQVNTDKVKTLTCGCEDKDFCNDPSSGSLVQPPGGADGASKGAGGDGETATKGPGGDGGTTTKGPGGNKGSKGNAANCVSHLSVFLVFAPALVLFNRF